MEKIIKLIMQSNKDIAVMMNENLCLTINKDNRTIKADDIYRLLAYTKGDSFSVVSENESNLDTPVVQFFQELLEEITNRINRLNEGTDAPLEESQSITNDSHEEENEVLPF